jgi:hypothetical protein
MGLQRKISHFVLKASSYKNRQSIPDYQSGGMTMHGFNPVIELGSRNPSQRL